MALNCREQNSNAVGRSEFGGSGRSENFKLSSSSNLSHASKVPMADWWAEDLAVLRIDFYQRVLAAMRMKGLRVESIGGALMHFAQRSLKGLNRKQNGRSDLKPPKIKVPSPSECFTFCLVRCVLGLQAAIHVAKLAAELFYIYCILPYYPLCLLACLKLNL